METEKGPAYKYPKTELIALSDQFIFLSDPKGLILVDYDGTMSKKGDVALEILIESMTRLLGKPQLGEVLLKEIIAYQRSVGSMSIVPEDFYQGKVDSINGESVALTLPFFMAAKIEDQQVKNLAREKIELMPGIEQMSRSMKEKGLAMGVITTSCSQGCEHLREALDISDKNIIASHLPLDDFTKRWTNKNEEGAIVVDFLGKLSLNLELGESEQSVSALGDFYQSLEGTQLKEFIDEVLVVGGQNKAFLVHHLVKRFQEKRGRPFNYDDVVYVGDSTTDRVVLWRVKEKEGLSIVINSERADVLAQGNLSLTTGNLNDLSLVVEHYLETGNLSSSADLCLSEGSKMEILQ